MLKIPFAAALLCCLSPLYAQAQESPRPGIAQPSLYAVNSAGLATAMTYCSTRHSGLTQGSPGAACFSRARSILAGFELRQRSQQIDALCADPATFNTCLTPEIGKLVYALNAEFARQGL